MHHLVAPLQFAHLLTSTRTLVVDVRPQPPQRGGCPPNVRPITAGHYWHISRNALVRMGEIAQGSGEELLVVDNAARAAADVAVLRKAHLTDFAVLRGGAANYRATMRFRAAGSGPRETYLIMPHREFVRQDERMGTY